MSRSRLGALWCGLAGLFGLVGLLGASSVRAGLGPQASEEFFIVSSLDLARGRVVLKRPTEVTLVIRVGPQTVYRDERGQASTLRDLRAGDTVYITFRKGPGGESMALLVRRGAMTVEELQRRYLRPGSPPGGPSAPRPER